MMVLISDKVFDKITITYFSKCKKATDNDSNFHRLAVILQSALISGASGNGTSDGARIVVYSFIYFICLFVHSFLDVMRSVVVASVIRAKLEAAIVIFAAV